MKAQTKWGWLIAIYLFLAGLGGGAYIAGVIADFMGLSTDIAKIGVFLGFPCVFIGTMCLIVDLGKPINFWRAFMKPKTSWIARGTIIITFFLIIDFLHIILWIWPFDVLADFTGARHLINLLGLIFAFGTIIYTGLLLGASRPIAFWSTAMLPLLFLVSALSTGFMAVILASSVIDVSKEGLGLFERIDIALIILEIFIVVFYLQGTHRVSESRASAKLVLSGSVAPMFWIGVVLLGLLLPLLFDLLGLYAFSGSSGHIFILLASAFGIIGGLFLRQVVLQGGIHAPLKSGLFEYGLTNV
ncbi:MAG: polysulfide reductase NrfD [Candidatus Marinimicrobia bacterium]|nr:polysulfide reductase NrfD [Candidatus Neomarinimicrobiota bacterium]